MPTVPSHQIREMMLVEEITFTAQPDKYFNEEKRVLFPSNNVYSNITFGSVLVANTP